MLVENKVFTDTLKESIQKLGIKDKVNLESMTRFFELLIEHNQRTNLTRIVDARDAAIKHFADSLAVLLVGLKANATLIDIGTGGGFPGIVIALARRDVQVTLLDATAKKTAFLETAIEQLQLTNVKTLTGRAEAAAHQKAHRERYDVAVWRGLGHLRISAEVCMPFVNVGGIGIAMKGPKLAEEIAESLEAINKSGAEVLQTIDVPLLDGLQHKLLTLGKKNRSPSGLPRDWAKIVKG